MNRTSDSYITYFCYINAKTSIHTSHLIEAWEVFLKPADGRGKILDLAYSCVGTLC